MTPISIRMRNFWILFPRIDARYWTWFTVASSIIICLMVLGLHVQQRNAITETSDLLDNVRSARIDMAKGFLHLSMAGEAASPFSKQQGAVLMKQALESFQDSFDELKSDKDYSDQIALFKQYSDELNQIVGKEISPRAATQMRIVFYQLDQLAERIDVKNQQKLKKLKVHSRQEFLIAISIATLLLGVICAGMYVSMNQQKKSQQDLEKSLEAQRRHEALLEETGRIAKVGGWELDVQSGLGQWTEEVALIHEVDPKAATSKQIGLEFYTNESREILEVALDEAIHHFKSYDLELEIITAKGKPKWIRTIGHPVMKDGKVVRLHGSFQDITEYKNAEQAIRERLSMQERLSKVAEATPGAIYEFRMKGDTGGEFTYVSPRFEELVGITPEEAVNDSANYFKLYPAEELEDLWESARVCADTLQKWQRVFRLKHPVKGMVWMEAVSVPSRAEDGSVLWHGLLFDVTERMQLEEQLRQSQKMETVGQLAGGMAHDFNNILTVIQGYVTLLEQGLIDKKEAAAELIKAVERASSFTRQLLTFSRKQLMQPRMLNLNEVVFHMAKMLHRTLGDDVVLKLDLSDGVPLLRADPGMLEQVIMNLSINARDAMKGGGELTISTCSSQITHQAAEHTKDALAGPAACICVKDNGCGISQELISRIFEPFFTTKEEHKGTGLGLSIVHGIVKQHQGLVTVKSEVGVGTTFEILLPATDVQQSPISAPAGTVGDSAGHETVLLVEDDASVRRMACLSLEHFGYKVREASSGREAVEVFNLHQQDISLLLTDMVMPEGMSGWELANTLQGRKPELAVVFSSGYGRDAIPKNKSCDYFLQKPYSMAKLAEMVRTALDGNVRKAPAMRG